MSLSHRPESTKTEGITGISVRGYKSLSEACSISIRPLTILAGANSSGKSSLMQPLLLLKQTLEASYDPGALLMYGPNVRFTSAELLSKLSSEGRNNSFSVGLEVDGSQYLEDTFLNKRQGQGFELVEMTQRSPAASFELHIRRLIHVPGLRGNPERTYNTTAVGNEFPGTFENYVASIVNHWQVTKDHRLNQLGDALEMLGLTWKVEARQVDDTQVELRVGRLPHKVGNGTRDVVNITDVGFGVSQTLLVVVALLTAQPGQLVYLEQPEIHLHPRAQAKMAQVLADAAKRGVRVVAETHSNLLLLAVQTLVAEGYLASEDVKLHWFQRNEQGVTKVTSADIDEAGAFGDWPEDFAEVVLHAESRYLDASEMVHSLRT